MNYKIGYFLKVPVYIHLTLLIPFSMIIPIMITDLLDGLIFLTSFITVYACVFLHEFGHILAARHFGTDCSKVVLSAIGGMAFLNAKEQSSKPKQELLISLAGPAVNLGLALFFALICMVACQKLSTCVPFQINVILCIFNMLPFYPMDGGRILKSALHLLTNLQTAKTLTSLASFMGSCFLVGGALAGGPPMFAVIGLLLLPFNFSMLFAQEGATKKP